MNDRAFRIVLLLALVPFIIGFAPVLASCLDKLGLPTYSSSIPIPQHAAYAVCSLIIVGAVLSLWRSFVRWNRRRVVVVSVATALLLTHAAAGGPIWAVQGCGTQEVLVLHQQATSTGCWGFAVTVVAWWALLRRRPTDAALSAATGRRAMSSDAVRLCIGLALVPFLAGLWGFTALTVRHFFGYLGDPWVFLCSGTLTILVAVVAWLLTWHTRVEWTSRRKSITALLALLAISGVYISEAVPRVFIDSLSWGILFSSFSLWFAGTAFVWRSTQTGAARRVDDAGGLDDSVEPRCPACSYSLVGLREVRCPECGWSSTVDQIVANTLREQYDMLHGV